MRKSIWPLSSVGPSRSSEYVVEADRVCDTIEELADYFVTKRSVDPAETEELRDICRGSGADGAELDPESAIDGDDGVWWNAVVNEDGAIWWRISLGRQAPWPEDPEESEIAEESEMDPESEMDEPFEPPMQISLTAFADEDRCLLGFC